MCVSTFREVSLVLKKEAFLSSFTTLVRKGSSLPLSVPFGKDMQIGKEESKTMQSRRFFWWYFSVSRRNSFL